MVLFRVACSRGREPEGARRSRACISMQHFCSMQFAHPAAERVFHVVPQSIARRAEELCFSIVLQPVIRAGAINVRNSSRDGLCARMISRVDRNQKNFALEGEGEGLDAAARKTRRKLCRTRRRPVYPLRQPIFKIDRSRGATVKAFGPAFFSPARSRRLPLDYAHCPGSEHSAP